MTVDRSDILNRLAAGQISAAEAAQLLHGPATQARSLDFPTAGRWLHIRITELDTGKNQAMVNLPLSWVKAGLAISARYHSTLPEWTWTRSLTCSVRGRMAN